MKTGIERCRIQEKKKTKKLDKIVRGVLVYWIVFVSVAWITYWVKDAVPDTLIQYGLGGGAVELLITGAIEIMRDRFNKEDNHGEA
ncbi:MAG: hypothetical protein J6U24_04150 [Paludibacteraceae bacterium]|nr:hypothetical protein [Paludibacteraceae bacterium]